MPRKTAFQKLAELEEATVAAHVAVQEAADAERTAVIEAQGALKALESYHIAVGAGKREHDVSEQARLAAAAADARANLSEDPRSGRVFHLRARGRLEGARQALAERERAEQEFARTHADEIATGMVAEAKAAADKIEEARALLRSAYRGRQKVATQWGRLAGHWGLGGHRLRDGRGTVPDDGAGRDLLQLAERAIGPHTVPIPDTLRREFEENPDRTSWPSLGVVR